MRQVFLSMLGVTRYVPCRYQVENWTSGLVTFIQEALVSFYCRNWSVDDRIFIFCTEEAEEKNWNDRGNFKQGLCLRLKRCSLSVPVEKVSIPEGRSEDEVMEIFIKIVEQFNSKDQVISDVTHSFRSIPLLASVVLSYAKVVKKIQVKRICYGALEAIGNQKEVEKIPEQERIVPVFDLTPFDYLLGWARAVDIFLKAGRADEIKRLLGQKVAPIFKERKDEDKTSLARRLSNFGNKLNSFCNNVMAVRGQKIEKGTFNFSSQIDELKAQTLIPPMNPLFDLLQNRLYPFDSSKKLLGFEAAKWCIEHKMVPQAYIFLLETVITALCKWHGDNPLDQDKREFWSGLLHVIASRIPERSWKKSVLSQRQKAQQVIKKEGESLRKLAIAVSSLRNNRNDFLHGGWRKNASSADSLLEQVKGHYENVRMAMTDYMAGVQKGSDERTPKHCKAIFLLSHSPTQQQIRELKEDWNVDVVIEIPDEIRNLWQSVSPDAPSVRDEISPVMDWLSQVCSSGDVIVVQGDYGATFIVVNWAKENGCIPVYATTERIVDEEKKEDGSVVQKRVFKHARFRQYE